MRLGTRRTACAVLAVVLAGPPGVATPASSPQAASDEARIVHVLNRLAYGPRPGDIEAVQRIGLSNWIEAQLHPERIADTAIQGRLSALPTSNLSTAELMAGYDIPREAKREIAKRRAEMGDDASEADRRKARRELIEEFGGRMKGSPRQVVAELQSAKIVRAVYSERQLDEVLVDFWMNHFNVFANKGPERFLIAEYEREVIRPRAWGRFEDLLLATAQSPAMLFYLDNWLSVDPEAAARMRQGGGAALGGARGRRRVRPGGGTVAPGTDRRRSPDSQPPQGQGRRRGLNENYAREIMELHTLGVDGGYTQKDVTEVARSLTGWTIQGLRQGEPRFAFDRRVHDAGPKVVLGQKIQASGEAAGKEVIHLLATHPSTARFISYKLARRFVADEPPAALVSRAAEVFRTTGGDIRAVVRAIVTSPEFLAADARSNKVKTPLEFVVSAVRASGAEVSDGRELAVRIASMGMPLYQQQPPTGYKDTADAWVSSAGLLARLNLALDLAAGRVRGVRVDAGRLAGGGTGDPTQALAQRLVPSGLSEATRRTLRDESGAEANPARVAGLILGSPEFQRR
jgi:uncharacterized protein (DUF1800 family)